MITFHLLCICCVVFICVGSSVLKSKKLAENYTKNQITTISSQTGYGVSERNIPASEINALQDLYDATNGAYWDWKFAEGTHWNFTGYHNPCLEQWQGVFCGYVGLDPYVNEIDLSNYNLQGRLPESIGNFTRMEYFDLNSNLLSGTFPNSLFNWQLCYALYMQENFFSGVVPIEGLIKMPAMSALRLDGNLFNGTLSNSIGQFNLLMEFTLATNYVTGTIPSSIGNISTLQYFELSVNKFTGTFPSCLWNLTEIITLEVDHNLLSGTIHGPFEQWEIIQELNVAHNNFTGILSPAMCNCSTMEFFQLNNNQFSGPIPPCLGNLTALHHLELAYNNVTGSIPDAIYSSKNLTNLSLAYNKMTGTLSNLLGQLSTLQYIDIGFNYFTSSLPIEWSTLTSLQEIYLEGNHFTGHIEMQSPSAVDKLHKENITTHLTQLRVMQFANNHFSGSIPHELYNVTTLIELYLVDNQLTGTLPEAVSRLHDLVELTLSYNHFSGSFPSFVDTLRSLTGVAMDSNLFTGHISCGYKEEMRSNSTLAEFVTSTNFLSGTISDEFDSCMRMTALMLGHNLFSGSLPEAFSDMDRMTFFTVDDNRFSGTLPTLARMPHLTVVFVQSNTFSGGLDGLVDPSTQKELEYIDVGNNQLTGTLPSALFELSKLNGFTAVSNCITGPIPLSVCYPQYLYFLDLDGLTTAPACQRRFVPHSSLFTSYMLTGRVTEGIPSCLFNMSSLETLHLSGNAIQWSFPRDLVLSETLTDLSISHNILTGTIPKSIQRKEWTNLDLSYNRLTGVLHSNVKSGPNTSLTLQVNRLSGYIPSTLQLAPEINILTGNLFACDLDRKSLPVHDEGYQNYQCGSNSFNQSIVAWIVFMGIGLVLIAAVVLSLVFPDKRRALNEWLTSKYRVLESWMAVFADSRGVASNLHQLGVSLNRVRFSLCRLTALILIVFMPTFIGLSFHYSTLFDQYAWFLSAAYLKGQTPAIIIAVFCLLFIVLLFQAQSDLHKPQTVSADALQHITASWTTRTVKYVSLFAVLLVNCSVMIALNSGYVYITLTYGTNMIVLAQVVVALFKLFWNDVIVRLLIQVARRFYASSEGEVSPQQSEFQTMRDSSSVSRHQDENRDMAVMTFIVLFNNILAPCFANMAVAPSCFVNVILAVPDVSSSYVDEHCTSYELDAFTFDCRTFSSETLSTSYAPPFLYNYQCSSSFITNYASVYVYMFMFVAFIKPPLILLVGKLYAESDPQSRLFRSLDGVIYTLLKPNRADSSQVLFFKEPFLLRIVGKLSIFLTFGVMFPPLAVVICVALCVDTYLVQLKIGYFLTSTRDEQLRHQYSLQLERDCQGVGEEQGYDSGLVILFAALFYAFFIFDIYGDAAGLRDAIILATVFMVIPTFVIVSRAVHKIWLARRALHIRSKSKQSVLSNDFPVTKNTLHTVSVHGKNVIGEKEGAYNHSEIRMSNMSEKF